MYPAAVCPERHTAASSEYRMIYNAPGQLKHAGVNYRAERLSGPSRFYFFSCSFC